jgi:type IV secretory pathway TrbF-like protein
MSLFLSKKKKQEEMQNVPLAADERTRQEIAENNPWMKAKKRHINVYHELASSVAQWRLATFTMLVLVVICVLSNLSLAKGVRIQPYVIQVDEHGYAIPVSEINASNIDARVVSAQIGMFIINSRGRTSDLATQLKYTENSYKSVARDSSAMTLLNNYYRESPPTNAKYSVSVKILSIKPISNASYQASWTETVQAESPEEFSYLGTFAVVVSPPQDYSLLVDNPLGVYITDYNIIRSH